jgi:hypothetical protein
MLQAENCENENGWATRGTYELRDLHFARARNYAGVEFGVSSQQG